MPFKAVFEISPTGVASSGVRSTWDSAPNRSQKVKWLQKNKLSDQLAKIGDVIAVLLGFDAPVILRPGVSDHYASVGETYVHGLMSGEAILGPLPPVWRAQAHRSQRGLMIYIFTRA